ncbi:MAG: hypothetical protein LBR49_07065 [Tannerella sp.]|nr:hypothetical protein [Tannerella sp.]
MYRRINITTGVGGAGYRLTAPGYQSHDIRLLMTWGYVINHPTPSYQ